MLDCWRNLGNIIINKVCILSRRCRRRDAIAVGQCTLHWIRLDREGKMIYLVRIPIHTISSMSVIFMLDRSVYYFFGNRYHIFSYVY